MDLQLTGKVAIVTGSSKGLGLASAKALAAEGCRVCICARGEETLARAAGELRDMSAPGSVVSVSADLSTADGAATVVNATIQAWGTVDILVNNVATAKGGDIVDTPDAVWQEA